jgi:S1-C subfamily serine protease
MPDIPDNVPIYVSSDYGDEESPESGFSGTRPGGRAAAPLDRASLSRDGVNQDRFGNPLPGSPAPSGPGAEHNDNQAGTGASAGQPQPKSEEQMAQSGFQSFRLPRPDDEKTFVFTPRTTAIIAGVTSLNLFLLGLWCGFCFIPREPVTSSLRPGAESLFGLSKRKGKPLTDPSNIIALAAAKAAPAVVNIDVKFKQVRGAINNLNEYGAMPSGEATGLIVRSDGYIATNAHVVTSPASGASEIKVTLNDGKVYQARLIGSDEFSDIAVIKIDADHLSVLPFCPVEDVHPGDWAIAIGSPLGFDHTVTLGVISAINRSLSFFNNRVNLIQHDAALNFGNSGGPIINIRGEVIGLNTAIREKAQSIGFATPSDVVADVVQQLIEHGSIPRPFLGVFMEDVDPDRSRSQTLPSHSVAVKISGLVADGPALKAGMAGGDIIEKVQGEAVHSAKEVRELTHGMKPGEVVEFVVKRNNAEVTVKVTLGDYSKLNLPH